MGSSGRRLALAGAALAVLCGGCDVVFGVAPDARPCGDAMFVRPPSADIVDATAFSVPWDRDRIVYVINGILYERPLPTGTPVQVDVSIYPPLALAITPEGDAMFVTAALEPPMLQAAVHAERWTADPIVPTGITAGIPSAAEFGPRRVLVRQRPFDLHVQEYEALGTGWSPVGEPHLVAGDHAPNLTPSGLDMVYSDATGVYVAHRTTTDVWFGDPHQVLAGVHEFPQLLDQCHALYVADPDAAAGAFAVHRYDR